MAAAPAGRQSDALDQRLSALMARAQDGDKGAYASLLEASTPVIRRVARKAGLVDDRIEDAVQAFADESSIGIRFLAAHI